MVTARPSMVVVSTYEPTRCGLASFSASLLEGMAALRQDRAGLHVARVLRLGDVPSTNPAVVTSFYPASPSALAAASARISEYDVALLQHEFGIYGPEDGIAVIELVDRISTPMVTTFHTVWQEPSATQREIAVDVAAASDRVVVTATAAAERLATTYAVAADKIVHIPHGSSWRGTVGPTVGGDRPILLSWGLLTPQKGIHHAIAALAELRDLDPLPLYWIQGATHPAVRRREGEAHRASLKRLALRLGVADMVHFDDRYLEPAELEGVVASAAAVIIPYERADKVSSGVLTEAVALGRPVVASAFTQARELKSAGASILLVDPDDPDEIAKAVFTIVNDPKYTAEARAHRGLIPSWEEAASAYHEVAIEAARRSGTDASTVRSEGSNGENPGLGGRAAVASNQQPP